MQCDASCCRFAPMTRKELKAIRAKHGIPRGSTIVIKDGPRQDTYMVCRDVITGRCAYLTDDKRCSIYEDRPKICRLYGTKEWPCNHCSPIAHAERMDGVNALQRTLIGKDAVWKR